MITLLGRIFFALIDVLLILLSIIALWIIFTGGGMYQLFDISISAYSAQNPLTFLFILSVLRYSVGRNFPFLSIRSFALTDVPSAAGRICQYAHTQLTSLSQQSANRVALILILISVLIKALNVWNYYGFFNGDDVEVHLMTLSKLFNFEAKVWDLRNPFFPIVFIFPVQAAIKALGVSDPFYFVAAGRFVGVIFSALSCWLVYRIASLEFKSLPTGLLALFLFAFSSLHITFASSEEPRILSSFFILVSILFLTKKDGKTWPIILSAVSLGVSASMRFSELVFIVPIILYLILDKRTKDALMFTFVFVIASAAILGIADTLYWGSPFYSFWNIVDYTLVKKLSSRGYEPFYQYLKVDEYSNYLLFVLFLLSLNLKNWKLLSVAIIPILLLSTLPHKESRYLVPVIPFVAILAGAIVWRLLEILQGHQASTRVSAFITPTVLIFLFCGSFLFEASGFRFRRSESAVDAARFLREQGNGIHVAFQQAWKSGLFIYLQPSAVIEDVSPESFLNQSDRNGKPLLESVQYIAMEKISIAEHGYESAILQHGFTQIQFANRSNRQGEYILFRKHK
jgi:hypothetical protein